MTAVIDAGLAISVGSGFNQWVGMHPELSNVYMCALTGELAQRGLNTPITDQPLHHVAASGWTVEDLACAMLPEAAFETARDAPEDLVLALAVESVAIRDIDSVPIDKILKLREDHGDEFRRFRAHLHDLGDQLQEFADVTDARSLAHHVDQRYRDTVDADLHELRKALRSQRWDVIDTVTSSPSPRPRACSPQRWATS